MPEEKIHIDVYKFGTYYNPASFRYNGPCDVGCDRCDKEKITVCIGWGNYDLCLSCVAEIHEKYENDELSVFADTDDD